MNKGKVDCVIGICFGDEGKGKIVDYLAKNYDVVARFGGGDNSGQNQSFMETTYLANLT